MKYCDSKTRATAASISASMERYCARRSRKGNCMERISIAKRGGRRCDRAHEMPANVSFVALQVKQNVGDPVGSVAVPKRRIASLLHLSVDDLLQFLAHAFGTTT